MCIEKRVYLHYTSILPALTRLLTPGFTVSPAFSVHLCCQFAFLRAICERNTLTWLHPPTLHGHLAKQTVKPEIQSEKTAPVAAQTQQKQPGNIIQITRC